MRQPRSKSVFTRGPHTFVFRRCLEKSLSRICPSRIPRGGKRAQKVNCYVVALDKGEDPYLLIQKAGKTHVGGLEWDPNLRCYSKHARILFAEAMKLRLKVIHYVGTDEIEYEGAWIFWFGTQSRIPYAILFARKLSDRLSRSIFNRRSQLEASRDKLLQYVVDEFAVSRSSFSSGGILTRMYNLKWYSHPAAKSARVRTEYLLESLVETGDLERLDDGQYGVTPFAFKTLADMRESQRRHRQAIGIQYALNFMTVGILLAALIQAGVVQTPQMLKAECNLRQGVAYDCNLRWHLWPNNSASALLDKLRITLRRHIN